MVGGILGKKVGMTQLFDSKGEVHPVTVLQAGPCVITALKSATRDGYEAVQIGLVEFVKETRLTKPAKGHLAKNNLPPVKFLREVPIVIDEGKDGAKVGDKVLVDVFDGEKFVDVAGTSKGRGFAGVVRRHNFGGGPKSHGHMFQVQGSIGASSFPSRVFPGQRMSGHMGARNVSAMNLEVVKIDAERHLVAIRGAVPGAPGGNVIIRPASKG